jgi:hypothetical protein
MLYTEFTINDLRDKFNIVIKEVETVVSPFETIQPSEFLKETLKENIPLALGIDTEKARSELMVIPILVEVRKLNNRQISLFSGTDLTVDKEKGLNGVCDFILSHSPEQMFLNAPIFTLVEAKNDNIKSGIPQCIAQMFASQLFNQKRNNSIPCIYGAVTTGSIWKFLKLKDNQVSVETLEHFIENIESILGILMQIVRTTAPQI